MTVISKNPCQINFSFFVKSDAWILTNEINGLLHFLAVLFCELIDVKTEKTENIVYDRGVIVRSAHATTFRTKARKSS